MSAVYPSGVDAYIGAAVPGVRALLVGGGYTYADTHTTLTDVPVEQRVGDSVPVTVAGVSGGVIDIDDLTFPQVDAGYTVAGIVFYATDETNTLLAFIDRRVDQVPISITTDGGDITVAFPHWIKL